MVPAAQAAGPGIELALCFGQLQAVATLPGLLPLGLLLLLPDGQLALVALAIELLVLLAEPFLPGRIPDRGRAGRWLALLLESAQAAFRMALDEVRRGGDAPTFCCPLLSVCDRAHLLL